MGKVINHFKNSVFHEYEFEIPQVDLEALTVAQLEGEVSDSCLYSEKLTLKAIIHRLKHENEGGRGP